MNLRSLKEYLSDLDDSVEYDEQYTPVESIVAQATLYLRGTSLEDRCKTFCIDAHSSINQVRKYTKEPYWTHPISVAKIVRDYGGNEKQVCAALLHDAVEDVPWVTSLLIIMLFEVELATMVFGLTDQSTPEDGNRKIRKSIDRGWFEEQDADTQFVKLADLLDNTRSICEYDPKFAKVYLEEKRQLLGVVHPSLKDHPLYLECLKTVSI